MNALESQLDYCLGTEIPAPGRAFEVAPGVRWARMALPFALNHVNVWLLRDCLPAEGGAAAKEGWSIVDCGIDDAATRAAWEQLFATGLDGLPVLRVIVTHMHPDHIGSAHWLCERWGARLWISATDFGIARMASTASAGFGGPLSAAFMAVHGMARDPAAVDGVASRINYYRSLVPAVPEAYRRLLDRGTIAVGSGAGREDWTCHVGYGHSPEHMSFHGERQRVLISGDMVLPRISTTVSVVDVAPEADPLRIYLESI
jgi:glyoxylase-like metal-dependent hydrolase (beta-lactamase superfamily II)